MRTCSGLPERVRSNEGLGSNFAERPWRKLGKSSKDPWQRKCQVFDTVAASKNDENCDGQRCQVLLVLHSFVGGEENVEFASSQRKQLAVLDAGPASALNGDGAVTNKKGAETPWN